MNQLHLSGSFTKSASVFTSSPSKPQSPALNGYAHFAKLSTPVSDPSQVVLPPHIRSPSFVTAHATKPDTETKQIALNDLEEGIKLTILTDIERDQRMNQLKKLIEEMFERSASKQKQLENKRKEDHASFDDYVKVSKREKSELQEKYDELFNRHTNLQAKHINLENEYTDLKLDLESGVFLNTSLQTLVDMKQMEIDDLKVQLASNNLPEPDIAAFMGVFDSPDTKMGEDKGFAQHSFQPIAQPNITQPNIAQRTNYTKRPVTTVTDPDVLHALKFMADNIYDYRREPFRGINIGDVRYAFYFGKTDSQGTVGLITNVVISSENKVYNIRNIDTIVEMNWNQDKAKKGKRGYGHIYLGKLAGEKGFEVYLQDVFKSELGIFL